MTEQMILMLKALTTPRKLYEMESIAYVRWYGGMNRIDAIKWCDEYTPGYKTGERTDVKYLDGEPYVR